MIWDNLFGGGKSVKGASKDAGAFCATVKNFTVDQADLKGSLLIADSGVPPEWRDLASAVNLRINAALEAVQSETHKLQLVNGIIHSGL